jgi:transcriptional regulator with XRE-family HTH domain
MSGKSRYAITDSDLREKLRGFLARRGLNQKQFAASVGLSQPYVSDIMLGRRGIPDEIAAKIGYRKAWVRT